MRKIDDKYKTSGDLTKMDGTPLPEDEPLILFRAHDKLLPALLERYQELCEQAGCQPPQIETLKNKRQAIEAWQAAHADQVKIPD